MSEGPLDTHQDDVLNLGQRHDCSEDLKTLGHDALDWFEQCC